MRSLNVPHLAWFIPVSSLFVGASLAFLIGALEHQSHTSSTEPAGVEAEPVMSEAEIAAANVLLPNGRPQVANMPPVEEVWECEVAIIGGSLGGIAAAAEAMEAGAQTCLIELTPWLGGQISSQGVSAIDESHEMLKRQNFSSNWQGFKQYIERQALDLPEWTGVVGAPAASTNSCWVGLLCFPPNSGARAAQEWIESARQYAPESRWAIATAFKGAEFDDTGRMITAIHAVRRTPRNPDTYSPQGRLSVELNPWYSWESDDTYEKTPLRLQPPPGQSMMVIDATDTGELVGWAQVPYRLGSDSWATTGELHASDWDNPQCTQAFTLPFALGLYDDGGASSTTLKNVQSFYGEDEHQQVFSLEGMPMFEGRSFFNYRRMVSTTYSDPFYGVPAFGDITLVNWTRGNDWNWMDPPLILTHEKLVQTGHYQNWMGGISALSLRHGETHALMFARWLLENHATPDYPLTYLHGETGPMGTESGLSMVPYIREGRRILGQSAYGQESFMIREQDIRNDMEGRDFRATAIAVTHYDIDIHGCRYRDWSPTGEAARASVEEHLVRPIYIPLEAVIPQGVDNLLIGGKSIAATHIANAAIRVHHGEWHVGAASGAIAAWLTLYYPTLPPAEVVSNGLMPTLQDYLNNTGGQTDW
jgi:hypothetical protein